MTRNMHRQDFGTFQRRDLMRDATNHHANGRDTDRTHGATPRTHGATPPRHLTSPSHGDVTIREACELIAEFVLRDRPPIIL